jgi:hypothetical protein
MATVRAKAMLKGQAMERLQQACSALAKRFEGVEGVDLVNVPGRNDPELKHAQQLDLLANVLEQLEQATAPASEPEKAEVKAQEKGESGAVEPPTFEPEPERPAKPQQRKGRG